MVPSIWPTSRGEIRERLEALRVAGGYGSCYISGPMTDLPDFNAHSFDMAQMLLAEARWSVQSPRLHDLSLGFNTMGMNGDMEELAASGFKFTEVMAWDLQQVCLTDCTFVLPGWEYSTGAQLEVYVALKVGKPVYTLLAQREITELGSSSVSLDGLSANGEAGRAGPASPPPNVPGHDEGASLGGGEESPESDDPPSKPEGRHPNSARFHELVEEIGALHDKKQQDYGSDSDPFANVRASEEWGVPAWVGALVRLNDKVTRLKSFARKGSLANESAEDSMRDIAVYALIALVLYEQENE